MKTKKWVFRKADFTPEEALEAAEKGLALQIRLYGPDGGPTGLAGVMSPGSWNNLDD